MPIISRLDRYTELRSMLGGDIWHDVATFSLLPFIGLGCLVLIPDTVAIGVLRLAQYLTH